VHEISVDDPRVDAVRALLEQHLAFAHATTAPEDVFALDVAGLLDPAVTLFSLREGGVVLAIGALKELDAAHAELKPCTLPPRHGVGDSVGRCSSTSSPLPAGAGWPG
jgi:hypothetical protein